MHRGLKQLHAEVQNADQQSHDLITSLSRHYAVPWGCWVFLSLTQECKGFHCQIYCNCKIYWNHCFANFVIFHVCLIQIYYESKYSQKIWFLDSDTEISIFHYMLLYQGPGRMATPPILLSSSWCGVSRPTWDYWKLWDILSSRATTPTTFFQSESGFENWKNKYFVGIIFASFLTC